VTNIQIRQIQPLVFFLFHKICRLVFKFVKGEIVFKNREEISFYSSSIQLIF